MTLTLTGENKFALNEKLKEIKNKFLKKNKTAQIQILNGSKIELEDLKIELSSLSLFSPERLIIIDQPSLIKNFKEEVEQILVGLGSDLTLIILEDSLDKRSSYYKYLFSKTTYLEFKILDINALTDWIIDYTEKKAATINIADARYLIDRIGFDQYALLNELNKLILYNQVISRKSIELLSDASITSTVFDLIDSAFNGRYRQALNLYKEQRIKNVAPEMILAMFGWQLNILALVKSWSPKYGPINAATNLNPYSVTKAQALVTKLSFIQLRSIISKLHEGDLKSKTVSFSLDDFLQNLLLEMAL
jgi:DNA polymerase-3 subunit delta